MLANISNRFLFVNGIECTPCFAIMRNKFATLYIMSVTAIMDIIANALHGAYCTQAAPEQKPYTKKLKNWAKAVASIHNFMVALSATVELQFFVLKVLHMAVLKHKTFKFFPCILLK